MTESDWLSIIQGADYGWHDHNPGATAEDLRTLADYMGRPLPPEYATFLSRWNGARIRFNDLWQVRVWRSTAIPSWSSSYGFVPDVIPGALAFGDDGGSEVLVFDARQDHVDARYPVLAINYLTVDWDDAMFVADDFKALLLLRRPLLAGHRPE